MKGRHTTDSDRGSGITHTGTNLWLASTYSCEILSIDPENGKTFASFDTPGAGQTGAHGLEWRDNKLWVAVPPSATIYQVDVETISQWDDNRNRMGRGRWCDAIYHLNPWAISIKLNT